MAMRAEEMPTNWVLAIKGGVLAFLLHFMLVLLLDGTNVIVLSLMNFGSIFIGGLYSGKRAPSREMYHGMLAGLVKGVLDQSLMLFVGSAPNLLTVIISAFVGLTGGIAARHLYDTRKITRTVKKGP